MTATWRKVENENGFFYYLNETTKAEQWDHPDFAHIKQKLDDCNYIKYAAYRLASKIRVLQIALYMEEVSLQVVSGVFEKHKLGATEGTLCLENYDLEAVLSDIYFAANKQNHRNVNIDIATELMLNFLYNIFDRERQGKTQVLSAKLVLAFLSNTTASDIYSFMFNLSADHNNCVTRLRLQALLSKVTDFTSYIHEDSCFGQYLINVSVDGCFQKSPGLVGITESTFISWTDTVPQIFAWVPLLFKMKMFEETVHLAKCSICKTTPLIGFRYKCLKCSHYNQCQQCFLSAHTSRSHKLTHAMKEYCSNKTRKKFKHVFAKKFFYLIGISKSQDNFTVNHIIDMKELRVDKKCFSLDVSNIQPLSSPYSQLQLIIRQLESQNRDLHQRLLKENQFEGDVKAYLEEHRLKVAAQIHKLKLLKDSLKLPQQPLSERCLHESTPMAPNSRKREVAMDLFSPIYMDVQEKQKTLIKPNEIFQDNSTETPYSLRDVSMWIGGYPKSTTNDLQAEASNINFGNTSPAREMHDDLDEALAKLQQILANNFTLDESLGSFDNGQLKSAVTEVEGMLTSLIDNVESGKSSSVPQIFSK